MKCPKCKFEIDYLDHDVNASCGGCFYSFEAKKGIRANESYDLDSLMVNVVVNNWRCPECEETLFETEEEAIQFLKGESN